MIPCQRHLFSIPDEVTYLNCAYMGPLTHATVAAGEAGLRRKATPWTVPPADFFGESEIARALFAGIVGADAEGVAIVPATSYGIAVAAANVPLAAGQRVVTLRDQFPSNVLAWREAAERAGAEVVAVDLEGSNDASAAVMNAIDDRCAVAALPNVLWTNGLRLDLEAIGAHCRNVGAALVLDLTQSAGAMVTDLATIQPDFAVASSYKWLLGPYSMGFLYVAPKHREGRPLEENWIARAGSEDFSRLIDPAKGYQPGARRFDVGERANFALMPAAIAAMEQILGWGVPAIEATLADKTAAIAAGARALGLSPTPDDRRGQHYLGIALPHDAPPDLLARLAAKDIHVSQRGRSLRVTPHLYNDEADAERFLAALSEIS
jgi:selenocysteine lyase/cysteine desulfurase